MSPNERVATGAPNRRITLRYTVMAVVIAAVAGLLSLAPASAQPALAPEPEPPAPPTLELTSKQLGIGSTVRLTGTRAAQVLEIPAPQGLVAATLSATVRTTAFTAGGTMRVNMDGRALAVVELPSGNSTTTVPLVVTLPAPALPGTPTVIEIVVEMASTSTDVCAVLFDPPAVDLDNIVVTYTGEATSPTSIAGFLPPVLTRLDVVVADQPSLQQIEAALRIAADVTFRFGSQRPQINLLGASDPRSPGDPTTRAVVVAEGEPGIAVVNDPVIGPLLRVTGDDLSLPQQMDILTGRLARLPVASSASVGDSAPINQELVQGFRSFAQLGAGTMRATGSGSFDLAVPFSQSTLGGSTRSLVAQISGASTPIPDGDTMSLAVVFNGAMISTTRLAGDGRVDVTVDLPDSLLRRDNDLILRASYTPQQGVCDPGAPPITLQIDPSSTLRGKAGSSLLEGFERFPQALLPTFLVGVSDQDLSTAAVAVDLVAALQVASAQLLRPQVVAWSEALIDTRPTMLVGTSNEALTTRLAPPLALGEGSPVQALANGSDVQLGGSIAALEAFTVGSREVLLATWQGEASLLGRLVDDTVMTEPGWRGLEGDVVVQGAQSPPMPLWIRSSAEDLTASPVGRDGNGTSRVAAFAVLISVGVGLVLMLLVLMWLRQHRRSRREAVSET